jgi:hypothetical protein
MSTLLTTTFTVHHSRLAQTACHAGFRNVHETRRSAEERSAGRLACTSMSAYVELLVYDYTTKSRVTAGQANLAGRKQGLAGYEQNPRLATGTAQLPNFR